MVMEVQTDPWALYLYSMRSPATRRTYPGRLAKFLDFLGLSKDTPLEERARLFAGKAKSDASWTFNAIIGFVQAGRERVERREIAAGTLRNDVKSLKLFCEKNGISYSDGFAPYWNPSVFDSSDIRIFKLHGSLYWLRSESGKLIKILVKGLPISQVKYLTDEKVAELMIYPALQKDKQNEVYLWLFRKFIDALNQSDTIVIMGYSFRDREILESLRNAIFRNPKLWVVIVSPNASQRKKDNFTGITEEFSSRIVTLDTGVRNAVTDRKLYGFLSKLESARSTESSAWSQQSKMTDRWDSQWKWLMERYIEVEHFERLAWIYGRLSTQSFTGYSGKTEEIIENLLGPISLLCLARHLAKNELSRAAIWKRIFLEYCLSFEHAFFEGNSSIESKNPIEQTQLPKWRIMKGFDGSAAKRDQLLEAAQTLHASSEDPEIRGAVDKLIQTLKHFTFRVNPDDPDSKGMEAQEFLENYASNDLGLYKWAKKIVEILK
jgi:hypothetical protein